MYILDYTTLPAHRHPAPSESIRADYFHPRKKQALVSNVNKSGTYTCGTSDLADLALLLCCGFLLFYSRLHLRCVVYQTKLYHSEKTRNFSPCGGFRPKAGLLFRAWSKKKKKSTSWFAFKRPNTTFKKMSQIKKVSLRVNFFFLRIAELFFLGHGGNRFRLVELGGVEPLRKLFRQKLEPGTENKKSQEI